MEQLPDLPPTQKLSPRVIRILGDNPSKFTLQGTNTYLIGTGSKRLLLDTGEGKPKWKESLKTVLDEEKCEVGKVVLTHWHGDHVGGVKDVLSLHEGKVEQGVWKCMPDDGQKGFEDQHIFEVEGAKLTAWHTPGHTVDHMALYLEEEDALFTGDNVLGHGTAVFEDLAAYIKSLERMQGLFKGRAYPAHGDVIEEGPGKVREYIAHRRQREDEILAVLGKGGEWSSMEIVQVVYVKYPESLHAPAEGGVRQVLRKLEGEGRVSETGAKWKVGGGSKGSAL